GAKTPRRNLDRLPILLMKDDRHIVIRTPHLCDGHRLSPRSGAGTQGEVSVLSSTPGLRCVPHALLLLQYPTLCTPPRKPPFSQPPSCSMPCPSLSCFSLRAAIPSKMERASELPWEKNSAIPDLCVSEIARISRENFSMDVAQQS